ncbi:Tetratricopeptide repeat-containing protein [Seinonella peptonophila]|uniref:Tetratricopeptide repeat-containing protein n=1 Tax=Seinonella peptonophila TaxID=112248 RepID=A0A1M5A5G9_9BACL|nr:hypothetical protein [Seinonella peptonophila]SHF25553.1 Tetratricopeptide repeat-containing protein [Seinonella peptonophila]
MNFSKEELIEIGKYIRTIRKKRGFKLEDLADENISSSTISNIEKGVEGVSDEKRNYFYQKMGFDHVSIPRLIEEEKKNDYWIKTQLSYIEHLIDLGEPQVGLQELRKLELNTDYLKGSKYFLRGRAYVVQGKETEKAEPYFKKALELIKQSSSDPFNYRSSCYNQLGKISYYNNRFADALRYTDKGIYTYIKSSEYNQHLIFSLLMNKVVYLNKIGYRDKASSVLDQLWQRENEIHNVDVIANMYDLQATIHMENELYSQALETAEKGLRIARINKLSYRTVELLLTIGKTLMAMNKFTEAKTALNTALKLKGQVKQKHGFLPVYNQLGKLFLIQKKPEEAKKIIETAINEKAIAKDMVRYVDALLTLGQSLIEQGHINEAIELYLETKELTEQHSLLSQQHEVFFRLCEIWKEKDSVEYNSFLSKKFEVELELRKRNGGDDYALR